MERRRVLALLVHGGSAAVATVVGIPALIYAVFPNRQASEVSRWVSVGPLSEFVPGTMRAAVAAPTPNERVSSPLRLGIYVWRIDNEEVVVFSRSCTDLGCPITFDPGSECFFCPCHGGIFSKEGEPMAGPPDRPLYRYSARVVEGVLQVDLNSVPPVA